MGAPDGQYPEAGLVLGSDGNFYGTTEGGGTFGVGTVYRITTNGAVNIVGSLDGTNGYNPLAAVVSVNGNLYGTTMVGGASYVWNTLNQGEGVVFEIATNGQLFDLYSFPGGSEGRRPFAPLVQGDDGNLYGTTAYGGIVDKGTVFEISTDGVFSVLFSFNGTNGASPGAGLTKANDGSFYGTTKFGGVSNNGTVFRMTTNGVLTTLISFAGTNGSDPAAKLVFGNDGILYGTTYQGGPPAFGFPYGFGTIFRITTNGNLTTFVFFNRNNGAFPRGGLTLGQDGNLYGSSQTTIFGLTTNGVLSTLAFFNGTNGNNGLGLTLGNDGNLYGTTEAGGAYHFGTVFRFTPPPIVQGAQEMGSAFVLTWSAIPGRLYQVQYTPDLAGTNWNNLGNPVTATNNIMTISDPTATEAQRFYRIDLIP